jgi:thiamine pyrophosphokinase
MPAEGSVQDQQSTIVVIAAGEAHPTLHERIPAASRVIAADGGVDTALALGLDVALAVGDFDSVSAGGLAAAQAGGARVERHPAEKDATDLELALDAALDFGPDRVVVVGTDDGRLDHLLGSLLLLGYERYAGVELDALLGPATVHVVRKERMLHGQPGELVSLLPLHGSAEGVVTEGLVYPLHGETLAAGSSRGVSNVFASPTARVALEHGVLIALRPGIPTERNHT